MGIFWTKSRTVHDEIHDIGMERKVVRLFLPAVVSDIIFEYTERHTSFELEPGKVNIALAQNAELEIIQGECMHVVVNKRNKYHFKSDKATIETISCIGNKNMIIFRETTRFIVFDLTPSRFSENAFLNPFMYNIPILLMLLTHKKSDLGEMYDHDDGRYSKNLTYHRETLYKYCAETGVICRYNQIWSPCCQLPPTKSFIRIFALENVLLIVEPGNQLTIVYTGQHCKHSTYSSKLSFLHHETRHVIGDKLFLDGQLVFDLADFAFTSIEIV